MKTTVAILASTMLMAGAYAQAPAGVAGAASRPGTSAADARRSSAVERHIKDMHATLGITAAEESQWTGVAQAMRDSAVQLDTAIDRREAIVGSGTALDNLKAYGDIAEAHADGVRKLAAAFAPLYAAMPDDQKKEADDVFAQRKHRKAK